MGLAAHRGMPQYRAHVIRIEAVRPVDARGGAFAR
jgi:hypothetical protein